MSLNSKDLYKLDSFNEIDKHFTSFILNHSNNQNFEIQIASLLVSYLTGKGNTCISIPDLAGKNLYQLIDTNETGKLLLTEKNKWIKELHESSCIGKPGDYKPLILDDNGRLYLYRYWKYEKILSGNIKMRLGKKSDEINFNLLEEGISRLFHNNNSSNIDWQLISAISALKTKFGIITGGPGTGKTTTIIKIISLFLEQAAYNNRNLSIALAAPTGKAAARLKESILNILTSINVPDEIKSKIPAETYTLHRLLGPVTWSPYFYYNRDNRLPYDIVIVDESSMVDLALMAKLFEAVPEESSIFLFGDMNQLSSINAGAVFSDICYAGDVEHYSENFIHEISKITGYNIQKNKSKKNNDLSDSINMLVKNYRFAEDSGINELALAIQDGDNLKAFSLLTDKKIKDIKLFDNKFFTGNDIDLNDYVIDHYKRLMDSESAEKGLEIISEFTILCALRKGPFGVEKINYLIESILRKKGLIPSGDTYYKNRPIMILKNDYNKNLFNGDIGIAVEAISDNTKRIFFNDSSQFKNINPSHLPEHETVYAMTIHKSQGSEFDDVHVILPDRISEILTRELLYTAITRAKNSVTIFASKDILNYTIKNRVKRISGLKDALWQY